MQIEKAFTIRAPRAAVWNFLTDPRRVAGAIPGAAVTEQLDSESYAGTITVKVGPITTSYRGKMRFEKLDAESGSAEIRASGQDVKGRGGAQMKMSSQLTEDAPGETRVRVVSDVSITGILAQMGRGMIDTVSDQIFQQFSEAMREELEAPAATTSTTNATLTNAASGVGASSPSSSAAPSGALPPAATPIPAMSTTGEAVANGAGPVVYRTSAPIEVMSFGGKMLAQSAARRVRRPVFWLALAAIVALAVVAFWIRRR